MVDGESFVESDGLREIRAAARAKPGRAARGLDGTSDFD
jgi:hypothetical protein